MLFKSILLGAATVLSVGSVAIADPARNPGENGTYVNSDPRGPETDVSQSGFNRVTPTDYHHRHHHHHRHHPT